MQPTTFTPVSSHRLEYRQGKKVLATIDRNRDGSHFCFLVSRSTGFITANQNEAKNKVRDALLEE